MSDLPVIATMIGDPAGIGPEVCVKALATGEPQRVSRPVLIGNAASLVTACQASGLDLALHVVRSLDDARIGSDGIVVVLDTDTIACGEYRTGEPSAAGGRAVAHWMELADRLAGAGTIDGWIMGPIDKTSLGLAGVTNDLDDLQPPGSFMFRVSGPLRIVPLTEHVALREVAGTVTAERVAHVVDLVGTTLRRWGMEQPRIAVAGLNPHAVGIEERDILVPTVARLRAQGWDVTGPVSPDSVFRQGIEGRFDAIVSMYHDQGQIALKSAAFAGACTIYIGLPYVRLTIPHGTAMDIAGRGIAQHKSMLSAMTMAARLAAGHGFADVAVQS